MERRALFELPREALELLVRIDHPDADLKATTQKMLAQLVEESAQRAGVGMLVQNLKVKELQAALENVKINHGQNNPRSKVVLAKRLTEHMTYQRPLDFLCKHIHQRELLETFCQIYDADFDSESLDDVEVLKKQVSDFIFQYGFQAYLESFSPIVLRDIASILQVDAPAASSTHALVNAIIRMEPRQSHPPTPSQHPLEKDLMAVFHRYPVKSLRRYCKSNNLPYTGRHSKVISRIMGFLATREDFTRGSKRVVEEGGDNRVAEEEPSKAGMQPASSKRKRTGKDTKQQPTKRRRHESIEQADEKEEEEEEEEQKPVEKEDDSQDGVEAKDPLLLVDDDEQITATQGEDEILNRLDLDRLEEYPLATLRDYCYSEELDVAGTTRDDYIAAILKYNDSPEVEML